MYAPSVRLWGALEAKMYDVCVPRLEHGSFWKTEGGACQAEGRTTGVHAAEALEGAASILDLIVEREQCRRAPGVGKFEPVLDALGLGGGVPAPVARRLAWLSAARNCLVHHLNPAQTRSHVRAYFVGNVSNSFATASSWNCSASR